MSQLIQKINADLSSAIDPAERGKLMARKAAYLARVGEFSEAKSIVEELRYEFGSHRSNNVTLWIMLAEGLIHYFEKLSIEANDRILRAHLLSTAIGDTELAALTAAWMSHLEFEQSKFMSMAKSIDSALRLSSDENYAARTRVSMVLSDCYFLCGDRNSGQKWFLRGRETALKEGDQASVEALQYNKAAFSLAYQRAQSCFGPVSTDQLDQLRIELASARNLQGLTGINALSHIVHLSEARLLVLEGKYEQGASKLQSVRDAGPYGEYNFNQSMIDLELAYCAHRLNSTRGTHQIPKWNFDALDVDEQMLAAWMLSEIFSKNSGTSEANVISEKLTNAKKLYLESMAELQSLLRQFSDV